MGHDIRTRWHDFEAAVRADTVLIPDNSGRLVTSRKRPDYTIDRLGNFLEAAPTLPNYFIDPSCLDLLKSPECTKSLNDLYKMGRVELPHDLCLVEFSDPVRMRTDDARYFVLVARREFPLGRGEHLYHPYQCNVFMLYRPNYNAPFFQERMRMVREGRALALWPGGKPPESWAVVPQTSVMLAMVGENFVDLKGVPANEGMHCGLIASPWVDAGSVRPVEGNPLDQEMMSAAHLAVRALLMLLRVRGIEQRTVTVEKLNKARARRGQVRVPDHIVVNIGHYQTRSGERVRYDPSKPGHRFVRPHMRSGHYRRVWVGSGEARKSEERYIEPYLVNYSDGDEVPVAKRRVIKGPGDYAAAARQGGPL